MSTTDNNNLALSMGFKGSGQAQALPVYEERGAYTLGGYPASTDTQTPKFGVVVSENPAASSPGAFFCGIPTDYVPRGVIMYHAGIAMIDASKPDSFLGNQPMTIMQFGQIWLASWTKVAPGSIDPSIDSVVICNNTSGVIEFMPKGSTAPTGYTIINARVKSRSDMTSGAMLFVYF
jgi:hypothetical protein